MLLESLARDMDLPADVFHDAMAVLQRGELAAAKSADPQRARFRQFLKRQLEELKAGILSARHEQTLTTFAVAQLGMPENQARDDIHQVAAELGLRRVPLEEALRYVEEVVATKLADDILVERSDVVRLYHLGRDWGLEPADIDELVRYRIEENAARQRRERNWNRGVVAGAIAAAVCVVVTLVVIVIRSRVSTPPVANHVVDPVKPPEETPILETRAKPPSWWDTDLTIAIGQLRNERSDVTPTYEAIISDDASRRGQGYELLVEQAGSEPFEVTRWKPFEGVLAGCYALEPNDSAATRLRRAWLAVAQEVIDTPPKSADDYQAAIRPVGTAVKTLKDSRLSDARRRDLADELGRMLRTPLDPSAAEKDLQKQCLGALATVLLERLTDEIAKRPELLGLHYSRLMAMARPRLETEELGRLDAAIAAAAIQHAPDAWRTWEPIAQRGIASRDSLSVLRLVEAYERYPSSDVKQRLADRLFARLGISAAGLPTTAYAEAMRKALGASLPAAVGDEARWSRFAGQAASVLEESSTASGDASTQLRMAASLAWNVNLALTLVPPFGNGEQFDHFTSIGPPWERKTDEPESPLVSTSVSATPSRLSRDQQDTFDRYAHDLGDWQRMEEARRASYLRGLAQFAEKVSDLSPIHSRQIASYILGRKSEAEQAIVQDALADLRPWKQLRLALADGIEKSQLATEHLRRMVITLTGHDAADLETSRSPARRLLLRSVVDELSLRRSSGDAASEIDRWSQQLTTAYRERAQLLGASPAELEGRSTPAALLHACLDRLAASNESVDRLVSLAAQGGLGDPQQTALLQRALVQALSASMRAKHPSAAADLEQLAAGLEQRSAKAPDVVAQLRDGEATLLKLLLKQHELK
jgi:hypothetical protein